MNIVPLVGYRISGGVDGDGKKLISVHYKIDSSTTEIGNGCVLSVWDLINTTEENGAFIPTLVCSVSIPFIATIQDCKYYRGHLYVTSGYWQTYNVPLAIHVFDTNGTCITVLRDFPNSMTETNNSESEGLAFYDDGEKIRMLYAMHSIYEIVVS